MDNNQYKMGLILKEQLSFFGEIVDKLKMFALRTILRIDKDQLSVAIAVFEGERLILTKKMRKT
jgi:hypothetical protein